MNSSWDTARGGEKAVVYDRRCIDASDTTAQPLGACDSRLAATWKMGLGLASSTP